MKVREWFDWFGDVVWMCVAGDGNGVVRELGKLVKVDIPRLRE